MSVQRLHQLATESAWLAQRMAVNLLAATQVSATESERLEQMTQGFAAWCLLCRHMAELEDLAPKTSDDGRDRDEAMRERFAAFTTRYLATQTTPAEPA